MCERRCVYVCVCVVWYARCEQRRGGDLQLRLPPIILTCNWKISGRKAAPWFFCGVTTDGCALWWTIAGWLAPTRGAITRAESCRLTSVRSEWATPVTWFSARHLRAYARARIKTLRTWVVICDAECAMFGIHSICNHSFVIKEDIYIYYHYTINRTIYYYYISLLLKKS